MDKLVGLKKIRWVKLFVNSIPGSVNGFAKLNNYSEKVSTLCSVTHRAGLCRSGLRPRLNFPILLSRSEPAPTESHLMLTNMISVSNLSFQYSNEQPLFDDFNLQVKRGELFGLVGPNGAGKSTLISLICGLNKPGAGSITIDGMDFVKQRKAILENFAVVPQDYAFYPKLSARENLNFFAQLYPGIKTPAKQIEHVIELTGLGGFAHRQAATYSGGMKRRLNLAIGLLNQPRLLILDEPTVGIDPQSRHFILESIVEINQQGTTVLYTSHYMEEVERLCEQVAVIDHGQILASGNLSELLNQSSEFKAKLAKTVILHDDNLITIMKKHQLRIENGFLMGEMIDINQSASILKALLNAGIKVDNLHCGKQSLETLFFELTDTALRES